MRINSVVRDILLPADRSIFSCGRGTGLPGSPIMYTRPVQDSIGIYDISIISGSDQSDWILTLPDSDTVRAILGVDNAFYDASGVPIQMSWVELQEAAALSDYLFAGKRGAALYSVDMSADEALIMRVLGGLYVPVVYAALDSALAGLDSELAPLGE